MKSALEQLDELVSSSEYKQLEQAIQHDLVLSKEALIEVYQKPEYWILVDESKVINGIEWRMRISKLVTGAYINEVPVKLIFASLIPPASLKQGLKTEKASPAYMEAIEHYSSVVLSREFSELRLKIGAIFQDLFKDKETKYFFFPMNQTYGLLPAYDHDLIMPYFDILSFKVCLK